MSALPLRPQWTATGRAGRAGRRPLAGPAALSAVTVLLAGGLLVGGAGTATAAPAPAAGQPQTFGVQPATAGKPDQRSSFSYTANPGGVMVDHLAVVNISVRPLTLRVYAQDAFNTPDGGFDLLAARQRPVDVGAWVTVTGGTVTVPARSRKIVSFRLAVPAKATPGDHGGGIVASLTSVTRDRGGNPVTLDQRVGARIYLRVTGPLHPALAVTGMRTDYRGTANPAGCGDLGVSYQVRNDGNVRLSGRQRVRVSGPLGTGTRTQDVPDLPDLLPGNAVTVTTSVHCVRPTFRLTAIATIDPVVPVNSGVGVPSATARSGLWALPWVGLLMLLVLAALLVLYLRQRRRDRSEAGERRARETVAATAAGDG